MTKARDLANAADALDDVSATELGYVNGVTSAIQTQLDGKSSTSHNHDSTYISKSLVDAAGDLIYGSANDTVTRLGIGTAGQYLSVNSGATAPEWTTLSAGGMTLLSTTNLSGTSTVVSGISGSYTDLLVIVNNPYTNTGGTFQIRPNSSSGTSPNSGTNSSTADQDTQIYIASSLATTSTPTNVYRLLINQYANTSYGKPFLYSGNNGTAGPNVSSKMGTFVSTSAITSLQFTTSGGTATFSGGQVLIYGVK